MVIFNELRISEDKNCLIVDCEIEDIDGYDGMYIDSVHVEYYKNVGTAGYASDKAITLYEKGEDEDGKTHLRLKLDLNDKLTETEVKNKFGISTFDGGLFFVYTVCDGTKTNPEIYENYGCARSSERDTGVILDWKMIYEWGMGYAARLAKSCGNPCDEPTGFKQFILFWYALQLAISTCDYQRVRDIWDRIIRMKRTTDFAPLSSGCGCK